MPNRVRHIDRVGISGNIREAIPPFRGRPTTGDAGDAEDTEGEEPGGATPMC